MKNLLKPFKTKEFIFILLYDLLFYLIFIPFSYLFAYIINSKTNAIDMSVLEQHTLQTMPLAESEIILSQMQSLVYWIVGLGIILASIAILSWSLSRGLIYTRLLKQRFDKKYFKRFNLLNLLLLIIIIIISMIIFSLASLNPYAVFLYIPVFIIAAYFITLTYIQFTKKTKIFKAIEKGLKAGFTKNIIPALIILGVFILLNLLASILPYNIIINTALLFIFITWARVYFVEAVKSRS
ncbi:hypothetical protein GF336_01750 [Candidatus Woesearchaeota archaeon]|nr:hypothetical protein [Candidatus Woesearchaeota archaeon]